MLLVVVTLMKIYENRSKLRREKVPNVQIIEKRGTRKKNGGKSYG